MEFLGTGTYGTTVSGTNVLIVDVEQGVPFVDMGDRVVGDLDSEVLQRSRVGTINCEIGVNETAEIVIHPIPQNLPFGQCVLLRLDGGEACRL